MKKRIFAFSMVFSLIASIFIATPVIAASDSDIQLMNDLGIIEVTEQKGIFKKSFSRADFAKALNTLDKNDPANFKYEGEDAPVFAVDIDGNENYNHIATLIALGYMETDSENKFRPSSPVTKNDAVKAIVRALGYEPIAKRNGGTDSAYNALAQKLGLFSGVSIADSEALTAKEAAEFFANSMGVRFFTDAPVDLGNSCFYDNWGIVKRQGKIRANANVGLAIPNTSYKKVDIDGTVYHTELLIEDELVGSEVTFYTIDGSFGEEVVSVYVKNKGNTITLSAKDIEAVRDKGSYLEIAYKGDKTIDVTKKGFIIINGKTQSPQKSLFDSFKSGTVTFVDSGSGEYDVIHMTHLSQVVLDGVNADKETLALRYGGGTINLEDIDRCEIYLNDKAATLAELSGGMVAGIACDAFSVVDGELKYDYAKASYINIYASSRTATGMVESISDDSFFMDEMRKTMSESFLQMIKKGYQVKLSPGEYIDAYFDTLGELVYYEVNAEGSTTQYGYLIAASTNTKRFANSTQFKVLDVNGKVNQYETDKTFILDGEKVSGGSVTYTVNTENDVDFTKRQVVRYRVIDKVLREIDTKVVREKVETVENSLSEDLEFDPYVSGNSKYEIDSGAVSRLFAFKPSCVAFVDEAPTDEANPDESLFSVTTIGASSADYYMAGYDADSDMQLACVVRYEEYGATGTEAKGSMGYYGHQGYIVEKIVKSVTEDGTEGYKLTMAGDSAKSEFFVAIDTLKLYEASAEGWNKEYFDIYKKEAAEFEKVIKPGDVLRFTTNNKGYITYIEKMFDFESNKDKIVPLPSTTNGQDFCFVKIEKISGDYFIYSYADPNDDTRYIARKRQIYTTVPLYHVKTGKLELVEMSAVPSAASGNKVSAFVRYYSGGTACDHIFYIFD